MSFLYSSVITLMDELFLMQLKPLARSLSNHAQLLASMPDINSLGRNTLSMPVCFSFNALVDFFHPSECCTSFRLSFRISMFLSLTLKIAIPQSSMVEHQQRQGTAICSALATAPSFVEDQIGSTCTTIPAQIFQQLPLAEVEEGVVVVVEPRPFSQFFRAFQRTGLTKLVGCKYLFSLMTSRLFSVNNRDNAFGRIGPVAIAGNPANTVELCINECISQGYTLAGMEYADECCEHLCLSPTPLVDKLVCRLR